MISAASSQHEKILTAFIQAILRYFDQITGISAQTETPYLQKGPSEIMDVTGIIGLSGDTKGCVYFTSPEEKLNNLLAFIGERDISDELRCDIAGEIANTFAGNARRILGPGFMIAVPLVILGKPERIVWPKETETFVIPIIWQQMRSLLIICLGGKPLPSNAHFHTRAEEDMETEVD